MQKEMSRFAAKIGFRLEEGRMKNGETCAGTYIGTYIGTYSQRKS